MIMKIIKAPQAGLMLKSGCHQTLQTQRSEHARENKKGSLVWTCKGVERGDRPDRRLSVKQPDHSPWPARASRTADTTS